MSNFDSNYWLQRQLSAQQTAQNIGSLSGLLGNVLGSYAPVTENSSDSSNIIFYNDLLATKSAAPIAPVTDDDEVAWLRKRVDEVCWKDTRRH